MNFLLPRNPGIPIQPQCRENVENDKRPHDTKVAPSGRILRAELFQVHVGVSSRAIFAIGRCTVIDEVTTSCVDIGGQVLVTRLVGGRVELDKFNGGADDFVIGQAGREHAIDEVGEGGYTVHKYPEAWKSGGAREDTGRFVSNEF